MQFRSGTARLIYYSPRKLPSVAENTQANIAKVCDGRAPSKTARVQLQQPGARDNPDRPIQVISHDAFSPGPPRQLPTPSARHPRRRC